MAKRETSTPSTRRFIIWRFIIITILVVVSIFILVTLEDYALRGLISSICRTETSETPGQVLYLAFLLVSNLFTRGETLGLPAADIAKLASLDLAMLLLLIAPIAVGAVVFSRILERKVIAEQKARDAELTRFYQRRNLMISDMAHDLRTPVMSISGLAQALEDGIVEDDETRLRYLRTIIAKSEKMSDLVTMLFDYVQLDSEGFVLERRRLDLPQLMLREAAAVYTDVEDAGMELVVEVPEDPIPILADEKQLSRVIANLITNAVRHNASGTAILLALRRRAGVADIIVADKGKPIEGDVTRLFEPFAREDTSRTGEGNGLGLSIVKGIVDMHGYEISLEQPYDEFTKAFVVSCAVEG